MSALEAIIKDKIRQYGPMNMADYMGLCLGHPEHGYYMTRDPLGREGDFITAPEISQMFGEMMGVWLADSWIQMGAPETINILECGPGRGTLMADALRATKHVEIGGRSFHDAVHIHLLEMSPVLRDLQKKALERYKPQWHMTLESVVSNATDSPFLIIGNEFLDALPVRQLVFRETEWVEKRVKIDINDTLRISEFEADDKVKNFIPPLLMAPKNGDHLEVSHELQDFVRDLVNIILKQGGSGMFVDYGFTHNVAGDTLQAVKNHAYCGVLEYIGEADLTAHINFALLSQQLLEENMTVHGPVSQSDFLKRLGIVVRADKLRLNATGAKRVDIDLALKRLTGENTKGGDMGALFKVIGFSSDPSITLAGFA